MEVSAKLRYLRMAPRKIRAVLEMIKNLDVVSAEAQLKLSPKRAAKPILKLLHSAVANALNQYSVKKEDLYIKKIFADEGPTLYRWMPRAFGRATPIRKRSSHLTIILSTKKEVPLKKIEKKEPEKIEVKKETEISLEKEKKREERERAKKDLRLKRRESFIKRMFRRKAI
ncbi:MAG: 50S ribosomal protein L22 [Patescibacteria group bacterium]